MDISSLPINNMLKNRHNKLNQSINRYRIYLLKLVMNCIKYKSTQMPKKFKNILSNI